MKITQSVISPLFPLNYTRGLTFEDSLSRTRFRELAFEDSHLRTRFWGLTFEDSLFRTRLWGLAFQDLVSRTHFWGLGFKDSLLRTRLETMYRDLELFSNIGTFILKKWTFFGKMTHCVHSKLATLVIFGLTLPSLIMVDLRLKLMEVCQRCFRRQPRKLEVNNVILTTTSSATIIDQRWAFGTGKELRSRG
jgi:hypothetical protein